MNQKLSMTIKHIEWCVMNHFSIHKRDIKGRYILID